jgi:CxxC-x17-CxxC domain-containing protein
MFVFTAAEQAFYAEKQLASPPKRCKACRQARKASRGGGGGGGGYDTHARGRGPRPMGRGPREGGAPRRFTGDVNEYRSPMTGGQLDGRGGGGDFRRRDSGQRGRPARGPGASPRGRDAGGYGPPRSFGGSSDEYRSPAFPEERDRGRARDARSRDTRPHSDRQHDGNRRSDAPRSHDGTPSVSKPRPERPKFDITCATCGVQAQVPFKPLEGREVFCQDCYRARRGSRGDAPAVNGSPDASARAEGSARNDSANDDAGGPDTGIVE